ncbi:hypothetical protein KP509_11G043500 [Ceratopteris richardii]|uniref:1-phosphatidylinositol 4-kinase n=2 Tax=Ceratopteris richardii TaxID=49495 RepID=A0A8T2TSC5_CERRI|nr:hypothetical protein KP509_11G043500 [Ceratopteris richardii]
MCLLRERKEEGGTISGMDFLKEFVDVLAENPQLARDKLVWIQSQCSIREVEGSLFTISDSQLQGVLVIARFLSRCEDSQAGNELLDILLKFLNIIPSLSRASAFPEWFTFDAATVFFTEMAGYLVKTVELGSLRKDTISSVLSTLIKSLISEESRLQNPVCRALLTALSRFCPNLEGHDIDQLGMCLLKNNMLPISGDFPTFQQGSFIDDRKSSSVKSLNDGAKVADELIAGVPAFESRNYEHRKKSEDSSLEYETRSSSSSTAPLDIKVSSPSKLDENDQICISTTLSNGSIASQNGVKNSTAFQVSNEKAITNALSYFDEDLFNLQKDGIVFYIFASILNMAESKFLNEERVLLQLRTAASIQLKTVPLILKQIRRESIINGHSVSKMNMNLQVCQAASLVYTRSFLKLKSKNRGHKNALRETLGLLIGAANSCVTFSRRRLRACEELFDCLLQNVANISSFCQGQDLTTLFSWLKKLVMATCAQVDPWNSSQYLQAIVEATCRIIESGCTAERPTIESFLLSLAGSVRESIDLEEKEKQDVSAMQLNMIRFSAELVVAIGKPDIAELISPLLVEDLEEGIACTPSRLRLKLLDAVAQIATVGSEKAYRECVVLLTRSYLDKVPIVGSVQSRTLASEATTERVETLPGAFLAIASNLHHIKLRADFRTRLLKLCSEVGLAAESKSGKSGADLLGPLLPAVAMICSDFKILEDVSPFVLKLFRNLWFYIALFGLAPPIQNKHSAYKGASSTMSNTGSTNAVALQAVAGPYLWNSQWSDAVIQIALGTPPLVASSLKWVEDELELNELLNPGSRRGSSNDKAVSSQRAALCAALKDHVEMTSISTISGVKATFLLAVAYLENHRSNFNGGLLKSKTMGEERSALSCAFEYLEEPNLPVPIHQCLSAIVQRAFDASLAWLDERPNMSGVDATERESVLVTHTCFLLSKLTHRDERLCDLACKLLNRIKSKYPQVLWQPLCLDSLFCLVQTQSLPSVDPGRIASMQSLIKKQIRMWVIQSLSVAPCTTQGLLQERIRLGSSSSRGFYASDLLPLLSDIKLEQSREDGLSSDSLAVTVPALFAAAAAATGARERLIDTGCLEVLSNGIVSATVKSSYININIGGLAFSQEHFQDNTAGLILGGSWSDSFEEKKSQEILSAKNKLKEKLIASFLHLLQQFISAVERGANINAEAFRETCLKSAAFIVSELELSRNMELEGFSRLLRLLCWCPAYICSTEAMRTGVFVWTWLVSAAPHLSSLLLAELVDAWLWTVETGHGLFSSGPCSSGPNGKLRPQLTPGEPLSFGDRDIVEEINAHRVWLGFFFDRFEVVRHSSMDQLILIGRLLQGSLKKSNHFASHPVATGTFFSLLLLGLKYCSCRLKACQAKSMDAWILKDRIYRAAFGWFSHYPAWYDCNSEAFSQGEVKAVASFVDQMNVECSENMLMAEHSGKLYAQDRELSNNCSQMDVAHPVWGRGDYLSAGEKRKQLLLMLCHHEVDRLYTWANPLREGLPARQRISSDQWIDFARTAWAIDPCITFGMLARFPAVGPLRAEIMSLVQENIADIYDIPEALPFFVTPKAAEDDSLVLKRLPHWAPCSITRALEFLTPAYKAHPRIMAYVLRVLETYPPERVTFFMPQLVQTLRYDAYDGLIEQYLIAAAKRSHIFAHILIWQLQGEEPLPEEFTKDGSQEADSFTDLALKVKERIIQSFDNEALDMFSREFRFFDKVTNISGVLYPLSKEQRRAAIKRELEKIEVEGTDLYLPTDPNKLVRGIQVNSGIPLQSAAKVPIMITFDVVDRNDIHVIRPQACIFKVGDDCRQDVLALQVIALLRDIFEAAGLNLYLFPYGVLPTGPGRGIIEVVPNTRSRNQMGETTDGGLYEVFQQDYGPVGSPRFESARDNFVVSSAGYAVASLLLQPKDRHNGNLLFDNEGRLVHIDFGFILETSPGGNLRFENAHFKLSHEMTQLLDPSGVMKSDTWNRFVSLCVKGYLAARLHMDGIINAVYLMVDSGLPCFSRGDPIGNLRKRFHPEMSEREAANFMIKTCEDAYNKWTTAGYDLIQYLQQGIEK